MSRENPTGKSIAQLIDKHNINKLSYEENNLTVWEFNRLFKNVSKKILTPTGIVEKVREIKDSSEIQKIHKACSLGDKAYFLFLRI